MKYAEAQKRIEAARQDVQRLTTIYNDLSDPLERSTVARAGNVLIDLIDAYVAHRLWTVDGSSGADDAAALYRVLGRLGLEVP